MRRPRQQSAKNTAGRHSESQRMGHGYRPEWSEGALKSPIFQAFTSILRSEEEGKQFFSLACGVRAPEPGGSQGLITSRINNSDLEILEERLRLRDGAEACAVFNSGMAAISTMLYALLRPGDTVLFSEPLYGGTESLAEHPASMTHADVDPGTKNPWESPMPSSAFRWAWRTRRTSWTI